MEVAFYRSFNDQTERIRAVEMNAEEVTALLNSDAFVFPELQDHEDEHLRIVNKLFSFRGVRKSLLITYEPIRRPKSNFF